MWCLTCFVMVILHSPHLPILNRTEPLYYRGLPLYEVRDNSFCFLLLPLHLLFVINLKKLLIIPHCIFIDIDVDLPLHDCLKFVLTHTKVFVSGLYDLLMLATVNFCYV